MAELVVRGAREHNLRGLDLRLPGSGLTVVTGVSGSGKSSLVFDTLYAEGRRRYVEALGLAASGLRRPLVDAIDGLPPTIALRQHERAPGPHDTVGDLTGIGALLAVVWARAGVQHDPQTDEAIRPTPHDGIVADLLSLPEGTRLLVEAPILPDPGAQLSALLAEIRRAGFSRIRLDGAVVRLDEVSASAVLDPELRVVVDRLKISVARRPRIAEALRLAGAAGRGVIVAHLPDGERTYVDRPFSLSTRTTFPDLRPAAFSWRGIGRCPRCDGTGRIEGQDCPACEGERLRLSSRFVRYRNHSLPGALAQPLGALRDLLEPTDADPAVELALVDVRTRLDRLCGLGLGALPLARRAVTLSGGEGQRLRLARAVGQDLTGVLYLLDEPTAGLAPALVPAVIDLIRTLCDRGSAVIAVSHRRAVVQAADRVIELGPGGGIDGGSLLFDGTPHALTAAETPTGRWLANALPPPEIGEDPTGHVHIRGLRVPGGATRDLVLSAGGVTVLTGPPSAGSSATLRVLGDLLHPESGVTVSPSQAIDRVLRVEPVRTSSSRSLVATFVGLWDVLRELLSSTTEASIRGLTASHFSLATPGGRCEACRGVGEIKVDLGLLPPAWVSCEVCDGRRFQEDLLDITWKGRSAAALLDLPAVEALPLLAGHPRLARQLRALVDVGLGYVPLGQTTRSLSGGEGARLRLAKEIARSARGVDGALLLVDGPTDGLHPLDARAMVALLHRLARAGAVVVAASHDPLLIQSASQAIEVSPIAHGGTTYG